MLLHRIVTTARAERFQLLDSPRLVAVERKVLTLAVSWRGEKRVVAEVDLLMI